MAGMGAPPVTMNWSDIHWWSVASGWARIMLSRSNLGRGGRVRRGRRGSSDYRGSGEVTSNHSRSARIYRRSWESPVTATGVKEERIEDRKRAVRILYSARS